MNLWLPGEMLLGGGIRVQIDLNEDNNSPSIVVSSANIFTITVTDVGTLQ